LSISDDSARFDEVVDIPDVVNFEWISSSFSRNGNEVAKRQTAIDATLLDG
jgi:hypothetical protein